MSKTLQTRIARASRWLPVALLAGLPLATQAQTLNYTPTSAVNTTGTYTDLGTTGTAITTANNDDANSAAQPIGFTFTFNGTAFTQFVLNTNGIIRLGAAAPSVATLFGQFETGQNTAGVDPIGSTSTADVNLIAPFNFDLEAGTAAGGTEYRVATTGTAPNRVCTIQWKNVRDKAGSNASQYDSFNFQAKLFETSNNIEFVYGTAVAATTGTDIARFPTVGIKGSGAANGQTVLANKTSSAAAWSTTVFITGEYGTSTHNYRRTAPPDAGRTYRFVPTVLAANDVAVNGIFSLGQVARTLVSPHAVRAVVTNNSAGTLANIPVTLTVTNGGTTIFTNVQTVASLATGASTTVTFAAYPLTNTGVNTLTVAVPNDDVNTNNSRTFSQNVTTNRLAYVDATQAFNATGVGVGAGANGALAVRYTIAQPAVITSVSPTFQGAGTANTNYQIQIFDASGTGSTPGATPLFTSATQARPGATGTVSVAVPNLSVPAGDFFVAIKELDNNVGLAYQVEDPLRTGAFYFITPGATTWTSVNNSNLRTRLALEVGFNVVNSTRGTIGEGSLSVFPNPASRSFTLSLPAISGERTAKVTLLNNLGQQVQVRNLELNVAGTQTKFDVSGLAAGVYTLRVQTGNQSAAQQVVVQ
jgi:hypothetical protein